MRLMLALVVSIIVAPAVAAQRADVRTDAEVYFNAERRLFRAETEASCSPWYPDILHRVIDLRSALRPFRRFANRSGGLYPLQRAARQQEQEEPGICIGVSSREIEPWLREARRDIALLRKRALRSRWRDPDRVTD